MFFDVCFFKHIIKNAALYALGFYTFLCPGMQQKGTDIKMKIGILTFHFAHNYGAMLQAYALKNFLEQKGHSVSIIPYESERFYRMYHATPFVLKKNPINSVKKFINYFKVKDQATLFENFKTEKLCISGQRIANRNCFTKAVTEFDLVIVGSDQVWNQNITGGDLVYFGDGVPDNIKLITYAASMGDYNAINDSTSNLIGKFDMISVRENNAQTVLSLCGFESVLSTDPVFLLNESSWRKLINSSRMVDESYILYYSLQEPRELLEKTAALAAETKLPVYMIDGRVRNRKMNGTMITKAGPLEFLELIANAEYICTDSFHALAFSVIFGKRVIIIPHKKTGDRMEQLLSLVGTKPQGEIIDCSSLSRDKLEDMITLSKDYLCRFANNDQ